MTPKKPLLVRIAEWGMPSPIYLLIFAVGSLFTAVIGFMLLSKWALIFFAVFVWYFYAYVWNKKHEI